MSDDVARTIAFAYKRRGAPSMERARLMSTLSFELRWFPPDLAKKLVAKAIAAGLLAQEGDDLRVTFDPASIDIPVNFRPREDIATDDAPADMPSAKLAALAPSGHGQVPAPLEDAEAHAERARLGNLVTLEVASLIAAGRRGEDVRERAAALSRANASR